jgi:hypothetical protein
VLIRRQDVRARRGLRGSREPDPLLPSYGITVLQAFLYYRKYHYDRRRWKVLVGVVMCVGPATAPGYAR